jgi:predicted branched-subunit amino acid permease
LSAPPVEVAAAGRPPGAVVFTRAGVLRGVRDCLPLLIGVTPFGLVTGIVSQGAGLSLAEATLMSVFVYAGSAQLVALSNWSHPAAILAAAVTAFAVNLRLALMGPVLAPWLDRLRGWRLWSSLFVMADQNWALSVKNMASGGTDAGFLLGSGLIMWAVWVATTALGYLGTELVAVPPGHPLLFSALAVFVSMLVTVWRGWPDVMPWLVAAGVSCVTAWALPHTSWYIVAGALGGSFAGAIRDRARAAGGAR